MLPCATFKASLTDMIDVWDAVDPVAQGLDQFHDALRRRLAGRRCARVHRSREGVAGLGSSSTRPSCERWTSAFRLHSLDQAARNPRVIASASCRSAGEPASRSHSVNASPPPSGHDSGSSWFALAYFTEDPHVLLLHVRPEQQSVSVLHAPDAGWHATPADAQKVAQPSPESAPRV